MDLRCKMAHMHGQALGVAGVRYVVGKDGILRDLPDEHAELLLRDPSGWGKLVTRQPAPSRAPLAAPVPPPPDDPGDDDGGEPPSAPKKTTKKKTAVRRRG